MCSWYIFFSVAIAVVRCIWDSVHFSSILDYTTEHLTLSYVPSLQLIQTPVDCSHVISEETEVWSY